tara:strand:- start:246 stop:371 length:126 start_codon:yes stop_codon:yes gene_type:complete
VPQEPLRVLLGLLQAVLMEGPTALPQGVLLVALGIQVRGRE